MKTLKKKRKVNSIAFEVCLLVLTISINIPAQGQISKKYNYKVDSFTDSIAKDYLVSFLPNENIGEFVIRDKGKQVKVKNYYVYLSFSLKYVGGNGTLDSVKIYNFGCHCEDIPSSSLMLVMHFLNGGMSRFVFGRASLENELTSLQSFFISLNNNVKEKYKLEVLDLFVKRRQGIFQTPLYIH